MLFLLFCLSSFCLLLRMVCCAVKGDLLCCIFCYVYFWFCLLLRVVCCAVCFVFVFSVWFCLLLRWSVAPFLFFCLFLVPFCFVCC